MLVIELKARTSDGGDTMSRLLLRPVSGEGMECDIVWYATRLKALQMYWLRESWSGAFVYRSEQPELTVIENLNTDPTRLTVHDIEEAIA